MSCHKCNDAISDISVIRSIHILVHIRTCLTISSKTWLMPIFGAVLLEKSVIWVYSILTFWLTHISYVHPFLWCGVSYFIKMIIRVYLTTTYQLVGSKHIFRNLQCNLCTTVCFRKEANFSKYVGKQKGDKMAKKSTILYEWSRFLNIFRPYN